MFIELSKVEYEKKVVDGKIEGKDIENITLITKNGYEIRVEVGTYNEEITRKNLYTTMEDLLDYRLKLFVYKNGNYVDDYISSIKLKIKE